MKRSWLAAFVVAAIAFLQMAQAKPDEPAKAPSALVDPIIGKEPGAIRDDNGLKMQLVWCPTGKFKMGSPSTEEARGKDENQENVTLTKGFWIGKYEITQGEYERITGTNPSYFSSRGEGKKKVSGIATDRFPVENVSYDESLAFCRKLTDQERRAGRLTAGWDYTLPTEAQWEYACRARSDTPFSFGTKLDGGDANCDGNHPYGSDQKGPHLERATTVGSYTKNAWGLFDMHGNVAEWCRDIYTQKLPRGNDPEVASKGFGPVYRGGSWDNRASACRSARRHWASADDRSLYLGFRLALSPVR